MASWRPGWRGCLVGVLSGLVVAGCASFPAGKLPARSCEEIQPPSRKVAIGYDAVFLREGVRVARHSQVLRQEAGKVFNQSAMFSEVQNTTSSGDYQFAISMVNKGNLAAGITSGVVAGLTLTLFPARMKDELVLDIDVKKGDKTLKRYRYEEDVTTWVQLLLSFVTPLRRPDTVFRQVADNMFWNFLCDLQKDKILEQASDKQ